MNLDEIIARRGCACTATEKCGYHGDWVGKSTGPRLQFAVAASERETYAQHNITFTGVSAKDDASIGFTPNSHDDQCHCEVCVRHRKRALVTETADKGKDVNTCLASQ